MLFHVFLLLCRKVLKLFFRSSVESVILPLKNLHQGLSTFCFIQNELESTTAHRV